MSADTSEVERPVARREDVRRSSGCMAGLEAEERERLKRMTSVERMALALRMGRLARAVAKRPGSR
jgi:hypothetical protein